MRWYIQQTRFSDLWRFSKKGMWMAPVAVLLSGIVFFVIYYLLLGNKQYLDGDAVLNYIGSNIVAIGLAVPIGFLLGMVVYYFLLWRTKAASLLPSSTHWTSSEIWKIVGISLYIIPAAAPAVLIILYWSWLAHGIALVIAAIVVLLLFGLIAGGLGSQKPRKHQRKTA